MALSSRFKFRHGSGESVLSPEGEFVVRLQELRRTLAAGDGFGGGGVKWGEARRRKELQGSGRKALKGRKGENEE